MIIDFHAHTFPDAICARVINKLSMASGTKAFTDASMKSLTDSMKAAGVDYSVNLPVMTSPEQVEKINGSMIQNREALFAQGIIAFGGLHPDYEDYRAEIRRLKEGGILGIKLHPAYQNVDLNDIRMMRIIEAASQEGLTVLVHAGIDIGIYDHDYASVKQVLQVLRETAPAKFVLAHMGGWGRWDDVERDLAGAPVYLDTAFSIREENLQEEQFLRIVRKHGSHRILFATDFPWEDQADYLNRIRKTALTEQEKTDILGENARKLLELS